MGRTGDGARPSAPRLFPPKTATISASVSTATRAGRDSTEILGALTRNVVGARSPTIGAARDELTRGLRGLLGNAVTVDKSVSANGSIILGTPKCLALASLKLDAALQGVGPEGFVLRSTTVGGKRATVIAANSDVGVLYGAFDLLRRVQTLQGVSNLTVVSAPTHPGVRMLDHWDNLNRRVGARVVAISFGERIRRCGQSHNDTPAYPRSTLRLRLSQ